MIPSIIDYGQINRDIYESIRDLRNKEQTLSLSEKEEYKRNNTC